MEIIMFLILWVCRDVTSPHFSGDPEIQKDEGFPWPQNNAPTKISIVLWIGWFKGTWKNREKPWFHGKIDGFRGRFSLQPIH